MTPRHIRIAGVIVLLAGLVSAVAIYLTAQPDDRQPILGIDIRTNRQRGQLERMGGKGYVMLSELDEWFGTLWHGRRLATTVGVLSVVGFLLCRGVARVHEDHAREAKSETKAPPVEPLTNPAKSSRRETA